MARQVIKPKLTLPDKIVSYFSASAGRRIMQDRTMTAIAGGYLSGKRRKGRRALSDWQTTNNDADGDILPDLPDLREGSRELIRSVPIASAIINTKVTNVVGTGLKMFPQIDNEFLGISDDEADQLEAHIAREWALFAESPACDWERTSEFSELQDLVFRSSLENGDVFCLLPHEKRAGEVTGLKVQILEADRVCNPDFKMDTNTLAGGIERTATGVPIKAHIMDQHPGSIRRTAATWTEREFYTKSGRASLLHVYRRIRPGQSRGVPDLAPIIETIKQMGDYAEAEISAAVVSGLFTAFVTTENGQGIASPDTETDSADKTTSKDFKMGSGSILDLLPGEKVEFANPVRPNTAFEAFMTAFSRFISAATEMPFELVLKHFSASYSASRASLLEAWKYFDSRRKWLIQRFCKPVYANWFEEEVASGRIYAPGFLSGDPAIRAAYLGAEWVGPARGHIQPLQEAQALREHVDMGTKTLERATTETDGTRWDRNHRQRAKEVRMRREAGLEEGSVPASKPTDPPNKIDQPGNDD